MRTIIIVTLGVVLALIFLAVGRKVGSVGPQRAAIAFVVLWTLAMIANLAVGVSHGYTVAEEFPILLLNVLPGAVVAARDDEGGRQAPVGHRDPGRSRDGDSARDARHDLDGDTVLDAVQRLLATPAEDEGVAPLEADDPSPATGVLDDDRVDLVLGHGVPVSVLADVDDLDARAQGVEQLGRAEPVGDDDVGLGEQVPAPDRDEVGRARPAADEGDVADGRGLPLRPVGAAHR